MTPHPHWTLDPSVRHLNHGSFGAVPGRVQDEQEALRREMERDPDLWFNALPERVAAARARIAPQLNLPHEELALVTNASAGVSAVLSSLHLPRGAELLLTDHAYGAVAQAAERAAARAGGRVRTLHIPLEAEAEEIAAAFGDALGPHTALVLVDQITSATARVFPVAEIAWRARAAGALTLVDGAHAPGMLPDPLGDAGCADFWVGNLHKWPCAPRGTGVLAARGEQAQWLWPLTDSWGFPYPFPYRFDHQGTADATAWLAAPSSLEFIEAEYGWDAARSHMTQLAAQAQETVAKALDADLAGVWTNEAPTMRLVPLPDGLVTGEESAHALRRRVLAETGCAVAVTAWNGRGFLRLSAHLYNSPDDYAQLAERLPRCLARAYEGH